MAQDSQFFTYEGNGQDSTNLPCFHNFPPPTMLMLSKVTLVEHSLPCELVAEVQRGPRILTDANPDVISANITGELSQQLAMLSGRGLILGKGGQEPCGIIEELTPSQTLKSSPGAGAIINQVYRLSARTRHSAVFLCHPDTKRALAPLKDRDGRLLFRSGMAHGDPDRLMDFPVHYDVDMPKNSLIFGDFVNGYEVELRPYVSILRDPYTIKPDISFMATMKLGGNVADTNLFDYLVW